MKRDKPPLSDVQPPHLKENMSRQVFSSSFRLKNRTLAAALVKIVRQQQPMTCRAVYYRAVSAGLVDAGKKPYGRLLAILASLRRSGDMPRAWLVDHARTRTKPSSWTGLADYLETMRHCYRANLWAEQTAHVELFLEKDAIAGCIQKVTAEYDVHLNVCRGYSSISQIDEVAEMWRRIRKPIFAYYLGDYDPSGIDMERELRAKLADYSGKVETAPEDVDASAFTWKRLAIRPEDFSTYNLLKLPINKKDSRAVGFMRTHGNYAAEVDAIPPNELRRLVREAIESHVDRAAWERLKVIELAEKESLDNVIGNFK